MLAFQHIPRELVVELPLRWLPVNQMEVFAVVIQVAPHAVLTIGIAHPQPRMVAVIQRKPLRHLFVAIKTLEGWRAGSELMAARALRCAA